MPPQFLFDFSGVDLDRIIFGKDEIRQINPQRGGMEMLDAIVHVDEQHQRLVGYKDIRHDEFWVAGHIPGRPLFPGVLMIELGAQLSSFYTIKYVKLPGFIGFGGVSECKFRAEVPPGKRMIVIGEQIWHRHNRICSKVQGIVEGNLAFEATVVGVQM